MSAARDSNRRVCKGSRGDVEGSRDMAGAAAVPQPDRVAAPSHTGTISGQVTDGDEPREATVAISAGPAHRDIAALADEGGRFILSGLLPGKYAVSVHLPGRPPQTKSADVEAGQTSVLNFRIGE